MILVCFSHHDYIVIPVLHSPNAIPKPHDEVVKKKDHINVRLRFSVKFIFKFKAIILVNLLVGVSKLNPNKIKPNMFVMDSVPVVFSMCKLITPPIL